MTSLLIDSPQNKLNLKMALAFLFAIFWIVDTVSTTHFVNLYGVEAEANPIMHFVIAKYGLGVFTLAKCLVMFFWVLLAPYVRIGVHVLVDIAVFLVALSAAMVAYV